MIDAKQLEALYEVTRQGRFDTAAKQLNITPSAISQRVKALEAAMGTTLLLRGREVAATSAGEYVLEFINKVNLLEHDLMRKLKPSFVDEYVSVALAVNSDSLMTWFQPIYTKIIKTLDVLPEIIVDDQDATFGYLIKGAVVGCVSSKKLNKRNINNVLLGSMDYTCVAHAKFAKKWFPQGLSAHNVFKAPAICYNADDSLHDDLLLRLFGIKNAKYPKSFTPSIAAIYDECGYGMVPTVMVAPALATGELVDLSPNHHYAMELYWCCWHEQSGLYAQISSMVVQMARQALA